MRTVLVVHPEQAFLQRARQTLGGEGVGFLLRTARTPSEALALLRLEAMDLAVVHRSVASPSAGGLLSAMDNEHRAVPVLILLPPMASPEALAPDLGVLDQIPEPVEVSQLVRPILDALAVCARGQLKGVSLASFLQVVAMERKTCTLRVRAAGRAGVLHFLQGELLQAEFGVARGLEAAYAILAWDAPEIVVERLAGARERQIFVPLQELLFDAARARDEDATGAAPPRNSPLEAQAASAAPRDLQGPWLDERLAFSDPSFPAVAAPSGPAVAPLGALIFTPQPRSAAPFGGAGPAPLRLETPRPGDAAVLPSTAAARKQGTEYPLPRVTPSGRPSPFEDGRQLTPDEINSMREEVVRRQRPRGASSARPPSRWTPLEIVLLILVLALLAGAGTYILGIQRGLGVGG